MNRPRDEVVREIAAYLWAEMVNGGVKREYWPACRDALATELSDEPSERAEGVLDLLDDAMDLATTWQDRAPSLLQ